MSNSRQRLYGLDIARILAMFLVVLFHATGVFSGFAYSCFAGRVLQSVSVCCVDLFALISGYVGVKATFRPSRFVSLWIQIVFTGLLIVGLGSLIGVFNPSLKDLGKVLLPISSHEYWYMTEYFLLFLLMPFLNAGLLSLSRKSIAMLLSGLCIFVVFIPSLNPFDSDTYALGNGFSAMWLVLCYVVGGSVRALDSGRGPFKFWLLTSIALGFLNCLWSGGYTHPSVLALAISILMMCSRLQVTDERVRKLILFFSSSALGVYLWHVHPMVYDKMVGQLRFVCTMPWPAAVVVLLLLFSVLTYLMVSILEYVRIMLFKKIGVDNYVRYVDTWIGFGK